MAEITAQMVKELRERTGAGMMDCKNALSETQGDMERAVDTLRKKGLAAAAKKAGRVTAEGAVGSYIHAGGKIGVLVEVNCETDFVARTDQFQELVRDIAMHIAASDPRFVRREEVTSEALERERTIFREQALASGKPANVVERIVEGKMEKYYSEFVLLEQPFVKDPDKSVANLIAEKVGKIGENIQVRRFVRFKLGEGIEKRQDDFAAEVMAQAGR
jgi:elongation factor Ts